jgi:hypothetical protein
LKKNQISIFLSMIDEKKNEDEIAAHPVLSSSTIPLTSGIEEAPQLLLSVDIFLTQLRVPAQVKHFGLSEGPPADLGPFSFHGIDGNFAVATIRTSGNSLILRRGIARSPFHLRNFPSH